MQHGFLVRHAEEALKAGDREAAARVAEASRPVLDRLPYAADLWNARAGLLALTGDTRGSEEARSQARLWNRYRFP